jgi:hypothetical protein
VSESSKKSANHLDRDWLTLDNAAKIYPATATVRSPAVFRLSVTMTRPVNWQILKNALDLTMSRFPYFQVYLKRGFFWYYLQRHENVPPIQLLKHTHVSYIPVRTRFTHMLRVSTRESTIAVDFSHIITDGSGGIRFLISLAAEYLKQCGIRIGPHENIYDVHESPDPEEFEDAYRKIFTRGTPGPVKPSRVFHIPGRPHRNGEFRIISGKVRVDRILELTRKRGVTLTEYLAALMIFCMAQIYDDAVRHGRPKKRSVIRLEVPVNMRILFPSKTMRNFSLYVSPEIDMKLGPFSLDELIKRIHHMMQIQINAKELSRQISRNVGAELNPAIRFQPLFVKDRYMPLINSRLGEQVYSGVLSNLGPVHIPDEMHPFIQSFDFMLNPNQVMKKSCSLISCRNDLTINICSLIESTKLERLFFTKLVQNGVDVTIKEV